MAAEPIILVPGFWLGAWAWDDVVSALRADGHDATAITLPGLESADADRSAVTLSDHVDAICEAVAAAGRPVVLGVHSASGFSGYTATDRIPERIAAMVYVDSAPGKGALDLPISPTLKRPSSGRRSPRKRISTGSARTRWRRSDNGQSRCQAASFVRAWS